MICERLCVGKIFGAHGYKQGRTGASESIYALETTSARERDCYLRFKSVSRYASEDPINFVSGYAQPCRRKSGCEDLCV